MSETKKDAVDPSTCFSHQDLCTLWQFISEKPFSARDSCCNVKRPDDFMSRHKLERTKQFTAKNQEVYMRLSYTTDKATITRNVNNALIQDKHMHKILGGMQRFVYKCAKSSNKVQAIFKSYNKSYSIVVGSKKVFFVYGSVDEVDFDDDDCHNWSSLMKISSFPSNDPLAIRRKVKDTLQVLEGRKWEATLFSRPQQMDMMVAFCMGMSKRVGALSLVRSLSSDTVNMILEMAFSVQEGSIHDDMLYESISMYLN